MRLGMKGVIVWGYVLCFLAGNKVYGDGKVYWQENGVCICGGTRSGYVDIVSDSCGGAIVVWGDIRGDYFRVCAQRVDNNGNLLWDTNGVIVTTLDPYPGIGGIKPYITTDMKGGAIITWEGELGASEYKIGVARIDSSGVVRWETPLCNIWTPLLEDEVEYPSIVSDGEGGAIIGWIEDYRTDMYLDSMFLKLQKVDSSGVIKWQDGGIVLSESLRSNNPPMTYDGTGGVIVGWTNKDPHNEDVYVQRVDRNGTMLWDSGGLVVCDKDSAQFISSITNIGGKIFIVWNDKSKGYFIRSVHIYSQLLNLDGEICWDSNGIPICTLDLWGGGGASVGYENGVITTWYDTSSGYYNIYGQKIDINGVVHWNENGVYLVTLADTSRESTELEYTLSDDRRGGAIIAWKEYRGGNYWDWDIYAQRVDSSGNLQWGDSGLVVAAHPEWDGAPAITSDGKGGAIIGFNTLGQHAYVQRVGDDTMAVEESKKLRVKSRELRVYPNPFVESCRLSIVHSQQLRSNRVQVYDLGGRLVEELPITNSQLQITIGKKLVPCIYFVKVKGCKPIKIIKLGGVKWLTF